MREDDKTQNTKQPALVHFVTIKRLGIFLALKISGVATFG